MNAQLVTSATGKYATTCRFCMKMIAESSPLDVPVIGEKPGERAEQREAALLAKMYKHLVLRHQPEFQQGLSLSKLMTELAKEYKPFLILSAFECQDPSASQRLENIRAIIFGSVRKNTMADNMIDHVVASMGLDPDDALKVNQAMKAIRDACCEFGEYAPRMPQESGIVIV